MFSRKGSRGGFFGGFGAIVASSVVASGNVSGARFLGGAGSAAAPTFSFTGDPDSGFYNNEPNGVGTSVGSANVFAYGAALATCNTSFSLANGAFHLTMGPGGKIKLDTATSASDLPLQFSGDPNTGIGYGGADTLNLVGAGSIYQQMAGGVNTIAGSGITLASDVSVAAGKDIAMGAAGQILLDPTTSLALPGLAFVGDLNTGIGWTSDGIGRLVGNGGLSASFLSSSIQPVTMYTAGVFTSDSYISLGEIASPAAIANRALLYGEDVAAKTAARAKVGAAGTVGTIVVEP